MGAGFHGGFGNTEGARDNETNNLIAELEKRGVKFTREDIVFITKDGTGQIVWLEKGNSFVGLDHIIHRHCNDFRDKHGVEKENISNHLKQIVSEGSIEYMRKVNKNGRHGYEKLYSYQGKYYLLSGVGTNGFIISCYPIDVSIAKKLKGRYGK